jgi:hypothetical protein
MRTKEHSHIGRNKIKDEVTEIKSSGQPVLAERRIFSGPPKWVIWLSYNLDRTEGTYLVLNQDGSIWRETTHGDGSTSVAIIKPADKFV